MGFAEEKNYLQDWLGGGSEPLMRGLQLAGKLKAELNGRDPKVNKPYSPRELLACLSDIVNTLNDGIKHLSSPLSLGKTSNVKDLIRAQQVAQKSISKKLKKSLPKYIVTVQGESADHYGARRIWRKYGQKHIQGKKHPRSYYKCFHQRDLNCPALKQVQQCDVNDSDFNITYIGEHTCGNTCDIQHVQNNMASPVPSHLHSNYCTSLPLGQKLSTSPMEPSSQTYGDFESYEEELEEEVKCCGFPPAIIDGLYTVLQHDVLPPDQVSNSIKVITAIEQDKESHIMSNFVPPIWDFEVNDQFLAFKDFESQL
eukprot:c18415_g1_i1 orf=14-949(-)